MLELRIRARDWGKSLLNRRLIFEETLHLSAPRGADELHRSFASLRMTKPKSVQTILAAAYELAAVESCRAWLGDSRSRLSRVSISRRNSFYWPGTTMTGTALAITGACDSG